MKKSTASRRVEELETPGSLSERTLPRTLATGMDTKLEESDLF